MTAAAGVLPPLRALGRAGINELVPPENDQDSTDTSDGSDSSE